MPSFGGYETVREISRDGVRSVYTARVSQNAPDIYAVKTFAPDSAELVADQTVDRSLFIEQVETQKKLTAANRRHWAPIHSSSATDKGAYFVTDNYPRNAQRLADLKIQLDAGSIFAVVQAVVSGLRELEETCGRPHGNLNPGDVLIGPGKSIAGANIVLSDPLPDSRLDPTQHRHDDLVAVGTLIFELVEHRPFKVVDWPIPHTEAWSALGRKANGWRVLANRLLDPDPKSALQDLNGLQLALKGLGATMPELTPVRILGVGGLIAAIVVISVLLIPRGQGHDPLTDSRGNWAPQKAQAHTTGRIEPGAVEEHNDNQSSTARSQIDPMPELVQQLESTDTVEGLDSQLINQLWQSSRDELIAMAQRTEDFALMKGRIDQLVDWLRQLESTLPEILVKQAPRSWDAKTAAEILAAQRTEAVRQALEVFRRAGNWTGQTDERALHFIAEEYNAGRKQVISLIHDLRMVEDSLDLGYRFEERAGESDRTTAQIFSSWEKHKRFATFEVVFASLRGRIERLRALSAMETRVQIIPVAEYGDDHAVRLSAWRRLGTLDTRPATLDELTREADLSQRLSATIEHCVDDTARRTELLEQIRAEARNRWQRCFAQLSTDEEIEGAIELMSRFDVASDEALDGLARFNIDLHTFKNEIATWISTQAEDEQWVRSRIDAVLGQRFGQIRVRTPEFQQKVEAFLDALAQIQAAAEQGQSLQTTGPASPSSLIQRHCTAQQDEIGTITYLFRYKDRRHRIEFQRVDANGDVAPFYMSTTEVSRGLFWDVVSDSDQWTPIKMLLQPSRSTKGPRVLEVIEDDTGRIFVKKLKQRWNVQIDPLLRDHAIAKAYPGGFPEEQLQPSDQHPVQNLPVEAAIYIAQILGCRLPTSAEWQAAYEAFEKDTAIQSWNLRDQAWAKQLKQWRVNLTVLPALQIVNLPDDGIFWPNGIDRREGLDAVSHDWNDRTMFFAHVDDGGGRVFKHLIGNVAEYTFDAPEKVDTLNRLDPQSLEHLVDSSVRDAHVIGGSALSSPNAEVDRAHALYPQRSRGGNSDVGLRLVFSAPMHSLYNRLTQVVNQQDYLTASSQQ